MNKVHQIKLVLQKLVMKFGEKSTDKGLISWIGDEELEVGMEVLLGDEIAPDGDYEVADSNMVIRVEDGKVAEIIMKEEAPVEEIEAAEEVEAPVEEAPVEEAPAEEQPDLQAVLVEVLSPITKEMADMKARLESVEGRLQEIEAKLLESQAKPADEAVESVEIEPEGSGFFRKSSRK